MTTYTQIYGSPATAIAVLDKDGAVRSLASVDSPLGWIPSRNKLEASNGRTGIMLGNAAGISVALVGAPQNSQESEIRYITSLCNTSAAWKTVAPTIPANLPLSGLTGDSGSGFTLCSADGKKLYQLSKAAKPDWQPMSTPLPFDVAMIAGDSSNGLLIVGTGDQPQLARSGTDCCSWTTLGASPIKVELLTGDMAKGFLVWGESLLYSLVLGKDGAPSWTRLPPLGFELAGMSGNPKDGIVALLGGGSVVAYCKDLSKPVWVLLAVPEGGTPDRTIGTAPDTGKAKSGAAPAATPSSASGAAAPKEPATADAG